MVKNDVISEKLVHNVFTLRVNTEIRVKKMGTRGKINAINFDEIL